MAKEPDCSDNSRKSLIKQPAIVKDRKVRPENSRAHLSHCIAKSLTTKPWQNAHYIAIEI